MFSSSSLKTAAAACSSPIGYYYHHLQQYHNLLHQESLFQHPNSVSETELLYQDETGHVPVGCTFSPLFDKRKAMNLVSNSAEAVPKGQVPKKKKKKTDNRSKIKTAQGLRDRRVRMSMGIAREFFDLQDLLGYDKPSRTLEWLLINSNKAILELSAAASSSTSDQETVLVKPPGHGSIMNQAGQVSCSASLKSSPKQKAACLAKQSRDRARARARARTVAKLSIANLNHQKKRLLKNSDGDMMCTDHQTYLCAKDHNFCSKSLMKSVVSESHKQERTTGEDCQQYAQNQQLQLQNYDYVIKSHDWNTSLNPILSPDHWNISCVYPHQGSSAAHHMNLSRDFNTNGRPRGYTL